MTNFVKRFTVILESIAILLLHVLIFNAYKWQYSLRPGKACCRYSAISAIMINIGTEKDLHAEGQIVLKLTSKYPRAEILRNPMLNIPLG